MFIFFPFDLLFCEWYLDLCNAKHTFIPSQNSYGQILYHCIQFANTSVFHSVCF